MYIYIYIYIYKWTRRRPKGMSGVILTVIRIAPVQVLVHHTYSQSVKLYCLTRKRKKKYSNARLNLPVPPYLFNFYNLAKHTNLPIQETKKNKYCIKNVRGRENAFLGKWHGGICFQSLRIWFLLKSFPGKLVPQVGHDRPTHW